ncbi:AAA family ATPase [Rheinheimera sp. 1928-s]|uniref:AAA family ATPase n=1 Tax=Rheinheimera sp. 1928-s TaxID=3033803 RepID=UPI00262B4FC5|nr:AAA family ATPase [Rheinheimera sp. 1928-s]MDF3124373.1 AAA family ATPase [Rheinheimera sp. 1928-s]
MIRNEFQRFMQTLQGAGATDPVRKLANTVLANLDEIIPLGTHQGQRIRRIVQLSQNNWDKTSPVIDPIPEGIEDSGVRISSLKRLTVGPFRGFARSEVFDLNSRLVLVYGPNGTGKSSFCEALEYSLLGNVAEAESKRFRDQNEYLKNAYVNALRPPQILATDSFGSDVNIAPNESLFRFCFVEKNRIDNFSRIAAQAPARQTELIATLFGLESFTEFVRNFTADIGGQYIDLQGKQALLLQQKQQALNSAVQQIQVSTSELQRITREEQTLSTAYKGGVTYDQMILELNGSEQALGLINQLDSELRQPPPPRSNLSKAILENLGSELAVILDELKKKQQQLSDAGQQVSFQQLYEAVTAVQQSSPESCPACKTPLSHVAVNPYLHAGHELLKLRQLAELQQHEFLLRQNAHQKLFSIWQILNICLQFYPQNNPLSVLQLHNTPPDLSWWALLMEQLPDNYLRWNHLQGQVQQLELQDKAIDQALALRDRKQLELNRLREFERQVLVLNTQKKAAQTNQVEAQRLVDTFQTENAQLIASVETEKALIAKNHEIVSAYSIFVHKLTSYNNRLPAQLVEDLGELVVTLYNAFNRNDAPNELLANVRLPLAQNQRLSISFQNQPANSYDALHILSEGHVRCLGLAILLAKNLKANSPVLIFDDPVNAIDDDHRESIRRTLFEDRYFADKQIILTCHGEEFFKDIQNLLPVAEVQNSRLFSFLPRLGEQHIRIDFNCAPRNYILAASAHIDRNEVRDALAKSRQALEALTKQKVWKYVSRYGDGNLSIKLRSATSPIELRMLTDQLRSKIAKVDFADQNKQIVYEPIDALLGMNGESREWRYLNKGTHEENDRAEFDRHTVQTIIGLLAQLDAVLG